MAAFAALALLCGYFYHVRRIGFYGDDLFEMLRYIYHDPAFVQRSTPLTRYVGQSLYAWLLVQSWAVSPLALHVTSAVLLICQAVVVYAALVQLQFSERAAAFGALFAVLAPFYPSIHMPIHALWVEFSSLAFWLGVLAVARRQYLAAALLLTITFFIYENFLFGALVYAAVVVLNLTDEERAKFVSLGNPLLRLFGYLIPLLLAALLVRLIYAPGRASEVADLSVARLIAVSVNAMIVGTTTSQRAFTHAIRFVAANPPGFIPIILSMIIGVVSIYSFSSTQASNGTRRWRLLALAGVGIVAVVVSYSIFVTPTRYPDPLQGRSTNVHGGARVGYILMLCAVLDLAWMSRHEIIGTAAGILAALSIAIWISYANAYALSDADVWARKQAFAASLNETCKRFPQVRNVIVTHDSGFLESRSEPISDWMDVRMASIFFEGNRLRTFVLDTHAVALDLSGSAKGIAVVKKAFPAIIQGKTTTLSTNKTALIHIDKDGHLASATMLDGSAGTGTCSLRRRPEFW